MELQEDVPTDVLSFVEELRTAFPEANVSLEKGGQQGLAWWITGEFGDRIVELEWKSGQGYRLYDPYSNGYGEGPIEVFRNTSIAAKRMAQFLRMECPQVVGSWLRNLRELRGVSQEALGERLGILQAAVSKIERREVVKLSSLKSITQALGGRLEIRACFPDCELSLIPENDAVSTNENKGAAHRIA